MSDARERFEAKTKSGYPPKFEEFCRTNGIPLDCVSVPRMAAWSAWQAAERDALERAAKVCRERSQKEATLGRQFAAIDCESAIRALAGSA